MQVFGREYAYGGHPFPFSGVFDIYPRHAHELGEQFRYFEIKSWYSLELGNVLVTNFRFKQSLHLGNTDFTSSDVEKVQHLLGTHFIETDIMYYP